MKLIYLSLSPSLPVSLSREEGSAEDGQGTGVVHTHQYRAA